MTPWPSAYGTPAHPGPLSKPNPVLVSAGNSPAGQAFSAKGCDFNFITFAEARQISRNVPRMAREDYQRDTRHHDLRLADLPRDRSGGAQGARSDDAARRLAAANNILSVLHVHDCGYGTQAESMQERFIFGWGGYPFVGSPEQVVETLRRRARGVSTGRARSVRPRRGNWRTWTRPCFRS